MHSAAVKSAQKLIVLTDHAGSKTPGLSGKDGRERDPEMLLA